MKAIRAATLAFWQKHHWPMLVTSTVALIVATLWPYTQTGFNGDDGLNNFLRIALAAEGRSLWHLISEAISNWTNTGRIFPASIITGHLFWYYLFDDLLTYRIIHLGFLAACFLLFAIVLRRFGASRAATLLACLALTGLFQIRLNQHDPIANYGPLMQMLFVAGFGSVLALEEYLSGKKTRWLVLSVCAYTFALLYYELSVLFAPLLAFQLYRRWRRQGRSIVLPSLLFGFVSVVYAATVLWFRLTRHVEYPGIRVQLSGKMILAFIYQLVAPLPLIHPIFGRSGFFPPEVLAEPPFLSLSSLILFTAVVILLVAIAKKTLTKKPRSPDAMLLLTGTLLLVFPALIVSATEKYQAALNRPGTCYLPVFFSYFGLALFCGLFLEKLFARKRLVATIAVIVSALIITLNHATNTLAVNRINESVKLPRELFEGARKHGFFDNLPGEFRLLHATRWQSWMNPVFWKDRLGREANFGGTEEPLKTCGCVSRGPSHRTSDTSCVIPLCAAAGYGQTYYYGYLHHRWNTGLVLLSRLNGIRYARATGKTLGLIPADGIALIAFSEEGRSTLDSLTLRVRETQGGTWHEFPLSDLLTEQLSNEWFRVRPLSPGFDPFSAELRARAQPRSPY